MLALSPPSWPGEDPATQRSSPAPSQTIRHPPGQSSQRKLGPNSPLAQADGWAPAFAGVTPSDEKSERHPTAPSHSRESGNLRFAMPVRSTELPAFAGIDSVNGGEEPSISSPLRAHPSQIYPRPFPRPLSSPHPACTDGPVRRTAWVGQVGVGAVPPRGSGLTPGCKSRLA